MLVHRYRGCVLGASLLGVVACAAPPPDPGVSSLESADIVTQFQASVAPGVITLEAGDAEYQDYIAHVHTELLAGPAVPVTLYLIGLPAGVIAGFTSSTLTIGASTDLELVASQQAVAGDYTLELQAIGAGGTVWSNFDFLLQIRNGPVVYSVTPSHGTIGDQVVIHGAGFSGAPGATTIAFGPYPVVTQSCTDTDCTVRVPPGSGNRDVIVTTTSASTARAADLFSYNALTVSSLSPHTGPRTGGTIVTMTGTGFAPDVPVNVAHTHVYFGGVEAGVLCTSTTSCMVHSPNVTGIPEIVGDVDVEVVIDAGAVVVPSGFTYRANPVLQSIAYSQFFGGGGSVVLDGYAPGSGTTVALSSSDPTLVAVPATMTVQPGFVAGNFTATFTPTDHTQTVVLTATLGGASVSTNLVLDPGPPLSVALDVPALASGASTTARISLNSPAPTGGVSVALASSAPAAITVPASVIVPAGQQTVPVTVTNLYGGSPEQVTITATYQALTASASIWVPIDGSCLPRTCGKGKYWNSQDCLCETGPAM